MALSGAGSAYAQESTPDIAPADNVPTLQGKIWVESPLVACAAIHCDQPAGGDNEHRTVVFTMDSQVYGSSGCNQYSGGYQLDGDEIHFGPLAVTRMYCDEESMIREHAFLSALQDATTYAVDGNSLTLNAASGDPSLRFETQIEMSRSLISVYLPYCVR
ncbi:MAG: META domain-containing protein [Caldilineaceae bacterium]|nr:META domain-containing protein [Caldilineaceae bacterium]